MNENFVLESLINVLPALISDPTGRSLLFRGMSAVFQPKCAWGQF